MKRYQNYEAVVTEAIGPYVDAAGLIGGIPDRHEEMLLARRLSTRRSTFIGEFASEGMISLLKEDRRLGPIGENLVRYVPRMIGIMHDEGASDNLDGAYRNLCDARDDLAGRNLGIAGEVALVLVKLKNAVRVNPVSEHDFGGIISGALKGLYHGTLLFDPGRGVKFVTYAWDHTYAGAHEEWRNIEFGSKSVKRSGGEDVLKLRVAETAADTVEARDAADWSLTRLRSRDREQMRLRTGYREGEDYGREMTLEEIGGDRGKRELTRQREERILMELRRSWTRSGVPA